MISNIRSLKEISVVSIALLATLGAIFVNDAKVFTGYYLFYFMWLCVVFIRLVFSIGVTKSEVFSQSLMLLLFAPVIFWEVKSGNASYYNAYFFAILFINVLPCLEWLIRNIHLTIKPTFFLLSFFATVSMLFLASGGGRVTVLFGPNVLYRIYFLLFFLVCIYFTSNQTGKFSVIFFSICFLLYTIALVATGSRGATLLFAFTVVYFLLHQKDFKLNRYQRFFVNWFGGLLFAALVYFIYPLLWRLLELNIFDGGNETRLSFYYQTYSYVKSASFIDLLIGSSSQGGVFYFYPHNILIEAMVYGGLIPFVIVVLSYLLFAYLFFSKGRLSSLYMLFAGFFIGSLISGDLFYNFPVISLPFFILGKLIYGVQNKC